MQFQMTHAFSAHLLMVSLKVPSSKGVSAGPKMTAFHCIMLLSQGAPLTPAGGSS